MRIKQEVFTQNHPRNQKVMTQASQIPVLLHRGMRTLNDEKLYRIRFPFHNIVASAAKKFVSAWAATGSTRLRLFTASQPKT